MEMATRELEQGSEKQQMDALVGLFPISHQDISSRNTQTNDRLPSVHSGEGERTLGVGASRAAAASLRRVCRRGVFLPLAGVFSRRGSRRVAGSHVAEGAALQAGGWAAEAGGFGGVACGAEGVFAAGASGPVATAEGVSSAGGDDAQEERGGAGCEKARGVVA